MSRVLALALALALGAGCVASIVPLPPDPVAPEGWSAAALVAGEGHDHASVAHHADLTTGNFEIVGWNPLLSPAHGDSTPAGYLCGDVKTGPDGRRIAVVESRSDLAFALADVTDPANPAWLGEFVMRTTYVYDVAMVPDGRHVVLATATHDTPKGGTPTAPAQDRSDGTGIAWRSPCAPGGEVPVARAVAGPIDEYVPRPARLILVDITDPASPTLVDERPLAGLGHSVDAAIVDGRALLLASTLTYATNVDNFQLYAIVDSPAGAKLEHLSTWQTGFQRGEPRQLEGGHNDGWIVRHLVTGGTYAWLADGDNGLAVYDLADPTSPALLGTWNDFDPARDSETGNVHSAFVMPTLIDGRQYTIVGPEFEGHPENQPSGSVYVLDTTDPSDMRAVAAWTLPHDVEWTDRLMFSTHYLGAVERTAFVSMYHGGVWALDLGAIRPGEFVQLPSVGVFMPVNVSPAPPEAPVRWTPTLEEVIPLEDGTLVTFDSNSGLYAFRFDASRPAEPPAPWTVPAPST